MTFSIYAVGGTAMRCVASRLTQEEVEFFLDVAVYDYLNEGERPKVEVDFE